MESQQSDRMAGSVSTMHEGAKIESVRMEQ